MFIYNVTNKVDWLIHKLWVDWMLNEHMPALIQTKCFNKYQLLKLHDQDDSEAPTYVAQYFTESKALYNRYIELHANNFRLEVIDKWNNYVVTFRTLMEVVN